MEISYGLVNLMYFMLCSEHWRIKGSRSNKRRKLLTCFTNSLFKVYNNLSLSETGPEVYNNTTIFPYERPDPRYITQHKSKFILAFIMRYVDAYWSVRGAFHLTEDVNQYTNGNLLESIHIWLPSIDFCPHGHHQ